MRQYITNEAGEPMGYEEVHEQDAQEAQWEEYMDSDAPDGCVCPKCKAKLMSEDAWDYGESHDHDGYMCWKCNTKF